MKLRIQLIAIVAAFIATTSFSQTELVYSGLDGPVGLLCDGDLLYIAEKDGGKVSVLDLTDISSGTTDLITGLAGPRELAKRGDSLFIALRDVNDIIWVDVTSPTPEVVLTLTNYPASFEIVGNTIYVYRNLGDSIYTADLTDSYPAAVTGFYGEIDDVYGMQIVGTDLYVADTYDYMIQKFDLTAGIPTAEDVQTYTYIRSFDINGDILYGVSSNFFDGSLMQYDISTGIASILDNDIDSPRGVAYHDGALYFTSFETDALYKFDLSLEISENVNSAIQIYPNPTTDFIAISGLEQEANYRIVEMNGKVVKSGRVKNGEQISLEELSAGTYSLELGDGAAVQFVKK